ncbi:MAG: NAD(P)/FAD-dependent oxidoreductase [Robiginitomaculum sp.]|nr:NAD(P)/FAD-dependent oxidoreductase [Robiginitomaculum sp.]
MTDKLLDIAIIGAGLAGIGAAVKIRQAGFKNFKIFEKTAGISGTWYDNDYPGAACDVPSHLYCYSFAPNPNWSRVYSPQAEIRKYVEDVVADHKLLSHIQFETEITSAVFDEAKARWKLIDKTGTTIYARFVLWSVSFLGTPHIPVIPGLDNFAGKVFHSARWDHSVDLSGKNVVIIGSAASALQIGPAIAKNVKSLTMFQRTANFVMPRDDREYSDFEKSLFKKFPFIHRLFRTFLFTRHDKFFFHGMRPGSLVNKIMRSRALGYLKRKIKDPGLHGKLTANYDLGCKRILISDDYYDMFNMENVSLQTAGIDRIESSHIETVTGKKIAADVIVMATGFTATSFMPGIEITGSNGASLTKWRDDLRALKGLMVTGFPNTFFMLGPNTGLGHSSMILMIESQLQYIMQVLTTLKDEETAEPKIEAIEQYNKQLQADLAGTVWATSCQSWYKREDGFIPTMWPHPTKTYDKMMRKVNWSELKRILKT